MLISEYNTKLIPTNPGVYIFRNGRTILYVGKAANLRKRVSSYFRKNLTGKINQLRNEADTLEFIPLRSEIEALLKEAELIKRHIPKFNVLLRDDKNYAYIAITDEPYPKIFVTHQTDNTDKGKRSEKTPLFIGPYTSSMSLKVTLKLLRKVFPYCTCSSPHTRLCLNAQISACPGYCCMKKSDTENSFALRDQYQKNIQAIISFFTGKRKHLVNEYKKKMRAAIKKQDFEQASVLRDHITGIEDVMAHRPHLFEKGEKKKNYAKEWSNIEKNIKMVLGINEPISRVEGYDISHLSGAGMCGSMVVFENGAPAREKYRMFKIKGKPFVASSLGRSVSKLTLHSSLAAIKTIQQQSDVDSLKEVLERRVGHREWAYPDLMVIDGGKPQLNAVMKVVKRYAPSLAPRVVALAKKEEELYREGRVHTIRLDSLPPATAFFFQRIRDESHRFAKRYHHKLREMSYRPSV
ncbi:MAG: UvrB/UvrC motif-containing protein [bacterium]|nr:UvrB/UvrC motif-containing protein [bacterium]